MNSYGKFAIYTILGLGLAGLSALVLEVRRVPNFETVKAAYRSDDRALLDRNGQLIDEVHRGEKAHRLNWVSAEDLPHALSEGEWFHDADLAASVARLTGAKVPAKILRLVWSKSEIFEAYLNLTTFRGELQGLEAASFALFDKPPRQLSRAETALLLASDGQPRVDSAPVKSKACEFLNDIGAPSDCGLLPAKHLAALEKSYGIRPFMKLAPKLAKRLSESPEIAQGALVRTTVDRDLQWQALSILQKHNVENGGVVVIDNDGQVVAYVDSTFTHGDMRSYHAGAMLKPFLYAKALDERVLTANTSLENSTVLVGGKGKGHKQNLVSMRTALAGNLNAPALKTFDLIGSENFASTLSGLGLKIGEESFGPSLAFGGVSVTLLELTNAYRALKTGSWSPARLSPDKLSDQAARKVFSTGAAFIVSDILRDRRGRVHFSEGDGGRTDHWAVGFSDTYTIGVWAGDGADAELAWQDLADSLSPNKENTIAEEPPPEDVIRRNDELFLRGTEPRSEDTNREKARSHISYPQNRAQIDFAEQTEGQPLLIQVASPQPDQNLYLNGRRLGRAKSYLAWAPYLGKFTLELRDSQGQVIDRVRFEAVYAKHLAL